MEAALTVCFTGKIRLDRLIGGNLAYINLKLAVKSEKPQRNRHFLAANWPGQFDRKREPALPVYLPVLISKWWELLGILLRFQSAVSEQKYVY